jgi:hypothetical protein
VAAGSLFSGVLLGARLAGHVDSPAGAAPSTSVPAALPLGPDFRAIARRATPAVVNISALQVYRVERSPFMTAVLPGVLRRSFFRIPRRRRTASAPASSSARTRHRDDNRVISTPPASPSPRTDAAACEPAVGTDP